MLTADAYFTHVLEAAAGNASPAEALLNIHLFFSSSQIQLVTKNLHFQATLLW